MTIKLSLISFFLGGQKRLYIRLNILDRTLNNSKQFTTGLPACTWASNRIRTNSTPSRRNFISMLSCSALTSEMISDKISE